MDNLKLYGFTVTLKPFIYKKEPTEQYDESYLELYHKIRLISNKITLIAEYTKSYNVHYHGIIELKSPRGWYKLFRTSKLFGFTKVVEIKELQGWLDYINKSFFMFYKEINRRPIILDDFDYFKDSHMDYGLHF